MGIAPDTDLALPVTLIGDVVDSRRFAGSDDRKRLQRAIRRALRDVGDELEAVRALEPTIGDEFQGVFGSFAAAVRATLLLRLQLLGDVGADCRFGIGIGDVTVLDGTRAPVSQDGPGWWAARAAIERAESDAAAKRTSFIRTRASTWRSDSVPPPQTDAMANAFLTCRDSIVGGMNDRGRRMLLGILRGRSQRELAAAEGITQGTVSKSLAGSGAYVVVAAQAELEGGAR